MECLTHPLRQNGMNLIKRRPQLHPAGYRRSPTVTIRWATPADARSLEILAQLDEAPVPPAPLVLAFVGDELWAAFSPSSGQTISDPFRPSAQVVDLVRERGRQLTVPELRRPRLRRMRLLNEPW
jgi:hypothetical protein